MITIGGVNSDGETLANDAILTLRIAAGLLAASDCQKWAADVNGGGLVKSSDAILILHRAAGLLTPSSI